jgi:hypothetical protein
VCLVQVEAAEARASRSLKGGLQHGRPPPDSGCSNARQAKAAPVISRAARIGPVLQTARNPLMPLRAVAHSFAGKFLKYLKTRVPKRQLQISGIEHLRVFGKAPVVLIVTIE